MDGFFRNEKKNNFIRTNMHTTVLPKLTELKHLKISQDDTEIKQNLVKLKKCVN